MQVRIYKPSKSPMQSANGYGQWVLEFVKTHNSRFKESLMGRTSSNDMSNEIKLKFSTLEEAIRFAENKPYLYEIIQPKEPISNKKVKK